MNVVLPGINFLRSSIAIAEKTHYTEKKKKICFSLCWKNLKIEIELDHDVLMIYFAPSEETMCLYRCASP